MYCRTPNYQIYVFAGLYDHETFSQKVTTTADCFEGRVADGGILGIKKLIFFTRNMLQHIVSPIAEIIEK
jgi:hypothetical protein